MKRTNALSRRGFLAGCAGAGLGAAAFSGLGLFDKLARGATTTPGPAAGDYPARHYIFCYFTGGWDVLLSLDPRNPAVFSNSNISTTRIQPAYETLNQNIEVPYIDALGDGSMYLGPYMGELIDHADKLCIFRGLSMDTLTHEVGRRRFLTGRPPSGLKARGSSTDTWLAATLGQGEPIPNLALSVESYNASDLPNYATALKASQLADLQRVLRPEGPQFGTLQQRQLDELLIKAAACPEASGSALLQNAERSRLKAADMVAQNLFGLFDFGANTPDKVALRDFYGINGTGTTAMRSSAAMAAMASTAIMNGVSRTVTVRINSRSLDTHFDNWQVDQGPIQAEGFTAIARMIQDLERTPYPDGSGDSWFDHTVIVGFSEFSRTPLINSNEGRDHWLTNSCFLTGGNIAGGTVIGASSNVGMNPMPVDLLTGQACSKDTEGAVPCEENLGSVEVIRPEHILSGLYQEIGLLADEPDMRVPRVPAMFKS